MTNAILGLDIGTTATKAIVFDLNGAQVAVAEQSYPPPLTPQPGWVELDPEAVWEAVLQVLRSIVARAENHTIIGLAMAAQAGSLVTVRADGSPTYAMITWMDGRSESIIQAWQADGTEAQIRARSGWMLHPGLPLPNIAWLRKYRPTVYAATDYFLGVNDFLNHRLTGRFCADPSCAAEMLLVDTYTWQWSEELCNVAGISPAQLAEIIPSGAVVGPLRAEVSQMTGLPPDIPVVNGGHDHCCSAMAMGLTAKGQMMLACGTAWVITGVVETPDVAAIPASIDLNCHVVPERWTISQFMGGFGASLEWFLREGWLASEDRVETYTSFNEAVQRVEPGANGLLFVPLTGPAQTSTRVSQGGFVGLGLNHTRADMARAVMEGPGYELRWAIERLRQANIPVEQLWMVGGAARSPIWPTILADVTGISLSVTQYAEWPALGAAILAGVGAGVFESLQAGQAQFSKAVRQIAPNPTHRTLYDDRFAAYQRVAQFVATRRDYGYTTA